MPSRAPGTGRRACAPDRRSPCGGVTGFLAAPVGSDPPADWSCGRGDDDEGGSDWGAILARLQRFYGGEPEAWLTRVPVALIRAYARMLPRLRAAEAIHDADVVAV